MLIVWKNKRIRRCQAWLQKTPNALFCVLGAVLFLLVFYSLAYRTPLNQVWMAPNMDNDEVIYNRQVVSVLTHGGPQGYFGYQETHADIGRYGTWGPFLIWMYALPGFLFGSSVNTVFWCNLFFTIVGMALFVRAARLQIWQQMVCGLTLVCLWLPLSLVFCGSSEALHYALALVIVGSSTALLRRYHRGWFCVAVAACALETVFRPYALLFWAFPLAALWQGPRRHRAICGAAAAGSFVLALFSMTKLSAPYFSGGGMDFGGVQRLLSGDVAGAISYEWERAGKELQTAWSSILPTLQGDPQYVGTGCLIFLVMVLVTVGCLVYDIRRGRPYRFKVCALICAGVVALVLVFMYNIAPRHLALLCMLMLGAVTVENARQALVYLPVMMILLLPMNAQRSSLSSWFPEMGDQITAVETALTESVQARESDDPWDYTLAYAYDDDVFHGYLYAVPAGMGIEFDWNTYLADESQPIYSRYAMVNHGTDAEARLLADGWQELVSTEALVVYERPDTEKS
mgnify:CR=1 FL=1